MTVPILIPELGAAGEPMRISAWYVESGETVEIDEPVVEIAVGGATCEISAPCRGRITGTLLPLDSPVSVGEVVAMILT